MSRTEKMTHRGLIRLLGWRVPRTGGVQGAKVGLVNDLKTA